MIPIRIKIAGCEFDAEISGVTLQTITDEGLNGEGCGITTNSVIVKDADLQLRGSALMFKNSEATGFLQQVNYTNEALTEDLSYTLDPNNGGTVAAS